LFITEVNLRTGYYITDCVDFTVISLIQFKTLYLNRIYYIKYILNALVVSQRCLIWLNLYR